MSFVILKVSLFHFIWGGRFPSWLTLPCKLTKPEPVEPEDTLLQRIKSKGDLGTFANKLTATQKVSMLFPPRPLEDHLHILVQLPSTCKIMRCPVDRPSLIKAPFTTFISLSLYHSHAPSFLHCRFPLPPVLNACPFSPSLYVTALLVVDDWCANLNGPSPCSRAGLS